MQAEKLSELTVLGNVQFLAHQQRKMWLNPWVAGHSVETPEMSHLGR